MCIGSRQSGLRVYRFSPTRSFILRPDGQNTLDKASVTVLNIRRIRDAIHK